MRGSINSFSQLTEMFVQQFASSRNLVKTSDDLYRILQRPNETTREILTRFTQEMVSIPNCDEFIAVQAFRRCLLPGSQLYKELTMHQVKTWVEVQAYVWAQIRWEEDDAKFRLELAERQKNTQQGGYVDR